MTARLIFRQENCNPFTMETCPFCQIISHSLPADIVYEDEQTIAIQDLHPISPVHILIIPKTHIASLNEMTELQDALLGQLLLTARKIAREQGIGEGYRLVINTGLKGGQTVFHLHIHLIGGAPLGADLLTRGLR